MANDMDSPGYSFVVGEEKRAENMSSMAVILEDDGRRGCLWKKKDDSQSAAFIFRSLGGARLIV